MLDIKFILQNPDKVKESCKNKQVKVDIDKILDIYKKKNEALKSIETIRAKKNEASKKIPGMKKEKEKKELIAEMKELDRTEEKIDENFKKMTAEYESLMLLVPNVAFDDVPIGKDDSENVVVRKVGEKPKFDFKFKDYLELAEDLDLIDVKRAAKTSGTRFGFIKREAVFIEFALVNLVFENLIKEGFIPILPPVMLKEQMARGTGYFEAADRNEAYFFPEDNLYLVGTSEQSLLAMHADEILEEKDLPKRYLGFSTCFRREAGAYGKDTKGILRVHQFDKIEMMSFCHSEKSREEHDFLLSLEEKLMQLLKIPYQVVKICTGDLGRPAAAKYDIEAWIPSENRYRETHSTSNCTDFQARRLNIRFRGKVEKLNFVHTLNGTAFAIGRTLIAMIENYQQKDGSILIPDALQKYLPFKEIHPVK
jgi:seryl-tRNA synthetase